jgi:hypothetical protein
MSAPLRGSHGGGTTNGRSTPPPGSRGRGAGQGSASGQFRGRGGRGRGTPSTMNPKAEGLLQGLQTGNLNKRGDSSGVRAGRGEITPSILHKRLEMFSRLRSWEACLRVANEAAAIYNLLTPTKAVHLPCEAHLDRHEVAAPWRTVQALPQFNLRLAPLVRIPLRRTS